MWGNSTNKRGNWLSWTTKCLAALFIAVTLWFGEYIYAVFALPVFLLDLCISEHFRHDTVVSIFKIFLLAQGVGMWYLNSVHFFDIPANEIQNAVLFHQQFDWRNATSMIEGISQRTMRSFSTDVVKKETIGNSHKLGRDIFPVRTLPAAPHQVCPHSRILLNATFGELPATDFPDLRYYSKAAIQQRYETIFLELPRAGFDSQYKNPCWRQDELLGHLACLPYAYLLGQPKSGTSDLFERIKEHGDVIMPTRKEVRWFTRGEFSRTALPYEGEGGGELPGAGAGRGPRSGREDWVGWEESGPGPGFMHGPGRTERLLGSQSSVYTFTKAFRDLATALEEEGHEEAVAQALITVDGGPHTFWWPTQSPDGRFLLDVPIPQLLREMQPDAKFVITLNDPVRRMFSDYWFLSDSLKPLRPGAPHNKSGEEFHHRAIQQVQRFHSCVARYMSRMGKGDSRGEGAETQSAVPADKSDPDFPLWFRASQMCAHDRHQFAVGGWGRLAIGLYVLFLEKWLEHFPPDQFLVVRLEDYQRDPRQYMSTVFSFLGLAAPKDWSDILSSKHFNSHKVHRDPIWPETEALLRRFYQPYNALLARALDNTEFNWALEEGKPSLHEELAAEAAKDVNKVGTSGQHSRDHHNHHRHAAAEAAGVEGLEGDVDGDGAAQGRERAEEAASSALRADRESREKAMRRRWEKARGIASSRSGGRDGNGDGSSDPPAPAAGYLRKRTHADADSPSSEAGQLADGGGHKGKSEGEGEDPVDPLPGKTAGGGGGHQGESADAPLELQPHAFSVEGLVMPLEPLTEDTARLLDLDLSSTTSAASHLCGAAFTLDLQLLVYLLYEVGIPADLTVPSDAARTALHCLALLYTLADAHSKSHVFSLLKGQRSWLNDHFHPPMELKQASVLSRDITSRLEGEMLVIAQWLQRAGTPIDAVDVAGWTALHLAAMGGELGLARFLLDAGASPNSLNRDERTPLHLAVGLGHAELAGLLVERGANAHLEDRHGMRPIDVINNPGPIYPEDATRFLNVTQRPAKQIERVIHPEDRSEDPRQGWVGGSGGWSTARLPGYESNMSCSGIDQYWADEITDEMIFEQYLARNTPVMIRGLLSKWKTIELYRQENLLRDHSDLKVQVSDIPYSEKFGSDFHVDKTLGEYVAEVKNHTVEGGRHPWYVFKGNVIPRMSDAKDSLVRIQDCPTPPAIQGAFERTATLSMRGKGGGVEGRKIFVNAQWALGGAGTGAPVHYHNSAWSSLIYGAKLWMVYPPHNMIMSNRQMLEYTETDYFTFLERGVRPLTCVQTAGDVIIIPESWGHGVLNIQESVTMATEAKTPLFRLNPGTKLFNRFSAAPPRPRKGLLG